MKKNSTFKRMLAVTVVMAASMQSFAYNNVWVKAEAYPTGAGKVYVGNMNPTQPDDKGYNPNFQDSSEFKATEQFASTAFLDYQVSEGYQFAGVVRDNGDGVYHYGDGVYNYDIAAEDEQIRVREEDGMFTAVMDPTEYSTDIYGSTTVAYQAALEAMEKLEKPTDHLFAVFTKGDIARVILKCSMFHGADMGKVVCSKLDNQPGDDVTFEAIPDVKYSFIYWSDADGNVLSTDNPLKVKVQGGKAYYANFIKTEDLETIEEVRHSLSNTNSLFDLQGRKMTAPRKGIYIRGGKKVVVK